MCKERFKRKEIGGEKGEKGVNASRTIDSQVGHYCCSVGHQSLRYPVLLGSYITSTHEERVSREREERRAEESRTEQRRAEERRRMDRRGEMRSGKERRGVERRGMERSAEERRGKMNKSISK